MTVFLRTLWYSIKKIEAPYIFNWEYDIVLHEMQEIKPNLPARGMCHMIARVVAGTWVNSRVTAGMAIRNSTLFSEVRTPV